MTLLHPRLISRGDRVVVLNGVGLLASQCDANVMDVGTKLKAEADGAKFELQLASHWLKNGVKREDVDAIDATILHS